MGINFESSNAELVHINIRKEGPEEDQILAIDLKFNCETSSDVVRQLVGAEDTPAFWDDNEDQDPFWPAIKTISTEGEFEQQELKFGNVHFKSVKVKKCSFTPRPKEKIDLVFSASVNNPGQKEVSTLAEYVKENLPLSVIAPPDLFENQQAA